MTYWKTITDRTEHVEIKKSEQEVLIWGYISDERYDGGGNSTSFEKFLKGEFHDWIEKYHGKEVLEEVIKKVTILMEDS